MRYCEDLAYAPDGDFGPEGNPLPDATGDDPSTSDSGGVE